MKCKRCGAEYASKELKCPYCGEENPLGIRWKTSEEETQLKTEHTKKAVLRSAPLYVINQLWNVVLIAFAVFLLITFVIAAAGGAVDMLRTKHVQETASIEAAEELYRAKKYDALYQYVSEHELYSAGDEFQKYVWWSQIYNDYQNLMEAVLRLQQEEDWGNDASFSMYAFKLILSYGQNILEEATDIYYDDDRREANAQYLAACKEDVTAILKGKLLLTDEDIERLIDARLYDDEEEEYFRRLIYERKGWQYEED